MNVHLVQGSSFMVPGDVVEVYATASAAAEGAASLVNILLGEVDLPADATSADWEAKLVAALEQRAEELGVEIEDTHEDRGDSLRHHLGEDAADVWITEVELVGAHHDTTLATVHAGAVSDASRMAVRLTEALAKPGWKPDRAHIEQARNVLLAVSLTYVSLT